MAVNSDISTQPSPSTNHLTWQHDAVNVYPQEENETSVTGCGFKKKKGGLGHISDICSEVSILSLACHQPVQQYAAKEEYIDISNTIATTNKMLCED
jgi:hypothetical protein